MASPTYDEIVNYPAVCREKFMAATMPNHRQPYWMVDKILDLYNLWLDCYSDEE